MFRGPAHKTWLEEEEERRKKFQKGQIKTKMEWKKKAVWKKLFCCVRLGRDRTKKKKSHGRGRKDGWEKGVLRT